MTRARDLADSADKDISGTLTVDNIVMSNDMTVADDGKVIFGAGSDLQIYHDGSHSYIEDSGTGNLRIDAQSFQIRKQGTTENMAGFAADGAVSLYYDNAVKLATTSTGVDVTGKLGTSANNNGGAKANYIRITDTDTTATAANQQGGIEFYASDSSAGAGVTASIEVVYAGSGGGGEITFNTAANSGAGVSEAVRIIETGFVGIGNASPPEFLTIGDATADGASRIQFFSTTNGVNTIHFGDGASAAAYRGYIQYAHSNDSLVFGTSAADRLHIDSNGNLLVGTTNATLGSGGIQLNASGRIGAAASSLSPMVLNRKTSDGTIIDLRKDGITVGSISSRSGVATHLILRSATGQGAGIGGANSGVLPCDEDGLQDNEINLGASGTRWQNLYLSGGVFLGGTGSSNLLNDYETGTWTPVIAGASTTGTGTYSSQHGSYVKVGGMVTLNFDYAMSAHTGSGYYNLTGLPFPMTSTSGMEAVGTFMSNNLDFDITLGQASFYLGTGASLMRIYLTRDNGTWIQQSLDTAHSLIGSITYRTDS